jgi:hypothetical protein
MSVLTIRFINEPGIVSRLIDWETNSLFCHTEGLSGDGQSWIGAHAGTGVEARPLDWCVPTFERRYAVPVTDNQYERAMQFMENWKGRPYNYADIIGLALHNRKGASEHEIICSAFMLLWLQAAGLWPLNALEYYAYLITPETLHLSPIFIGKCIFKHQEA